MSVETAMSMVLEAEKEAVAQLAASERRANEIVSEAREFVRALVRRREARLSQLHADCALKTSELVGLLEKDAAAQDQEPRPGDNGKRRLEEAVARVARELTEKGDAH